MRGGAFGAVIVIAMVIACNSLTGVEDLGVGAPPNGVVSESGAPPVESDGGVPATQDAGPPTPTCACVAAPAEGWTGPVAFVDGTACPAGLTPLATGGSDIDVSSPGCECKCSAPSGACTTTSLQLFGDSSCSSTPCETQIFQASNCQTVQYCDPSSSFLATMRTTGVCAASATPLRPPTFRTQATACMQATVPEGLCAHGTVCGPGGRKTCIVKDGDENCPAGPYTARTLVHRNILDPRTCNACTCGTPVVTCSQPTITLYSDNGCSNSFNTVAGGTCRADNNVPDQFGSVKMTTPSTMTSGSCPPQGGGTSGTATGKDPMTICCLPE